MQVTVADTTVDIETGRVDGAIQAKLERYLSGERIVFDEPINLSDLTAFQQHILQEIRQIPYGETITYAELAERIGNRNAYRATANACGANPVPLIIPCHRVVATNGIGGYSSGVNVKKELLRLEGVSI